MLRITPVKPDEISLARELIVEYGASLEVDLSYQDFLEEVASLPGKYAPPGGALLLARVAGEPAGCVALRRLTVENCEMKRLYVRPPHRGAGLGRFLVESAIRDARRIGYLEMRLDTLATMTEAHRLYESLGFAEIEPYTANFAPGSRFYGLRLDGGAARSREHMNPHGSPLIIREARADEGASLTEMALRSKATWGYDSAFMEVCRAELTVTAEQIRSERFRVVVGEIDGVCIGFYVIEFGELGFELDALFVDPDYTGRGCGRHLLEHAKHTAAQMGAVSLAVQSDPFAEPFYRAAGAEAIGTRESGSIPGRFLPLLRIPLEEEESG